MSESYKEQQERNDREITLRNLQHVYSEQAEISKHINDHAHYFFQAANDANDANDNEKERIHAVGFTGTRNVLHNRVDILEHILNALKSHGFNTLHHGDCIGGDYQAHMAATYCGYNIVVHPPINGRYRFLEHPARSHYKSVQMLEQRDYLVRNHDIVDASQILIAFPQDPDHEVQRSGTWATIRYARKQQRPIIMV